MKLFFSPTSPYARKVLATAIATGLDKQITIVPTNPHESPADLVAANPLSKIPCLITDDGVALFDSPVICEYLDAIGSGTLFPAGATRWRALRNQAIGDGMMDAAVQGRGEAGRPVEEARNAVIERYKQAVTRSLDLLESAPPPDHLSIGTLSVACALGYLDLRFAADDWRAGRPKLAAWHAKMEERPELARTAPPKG